MARPFQYRPPQSPYLEIIHKDKSFIVLNKPSGLLSVPGRAAGHDDCLEARVKHFFPNARTVHRLDMATSGVIVLALNADSHRNLSIQFERRKTTKFYYAKVWGHVEGSSGTIDLPLICDWPNRPKQIVDHENGKPSQTDWEVISKDETSTLVKLTPLTGRSHQLRVHMLSLGHPILGDEFYAHDDAYEASDRLMLHAHNLGFHHPDSGEFVEFEAPCSF